MQGGCCDLSTDILVDYANGYFLFIAVNWDFLSIRSTIPNINSVPCTKRHLSTA